MNEYNNPKECYETLVDLVGEVAVNLWEPDDLQSFSEALGRAVFTKDYIDELAPLPEGVANYLRYLAEEARAWPDADAVPRPLPSREES